MQLPGPFAIQRVQEFEWAQPVEFVLLEPATPAAFAETGVARDARFTDLATGHIRMSFHSLVVRTPHGTLLVDTCVGNHKDRPVIPEWHQQNFPYLERLAAAGLTPDDIDFVCCTHLHGDHIGWNTQLEDGRWVPTFRHARYLLAADELHYWEQTFANDPDSLYWRGWQDSVLPVIEAGLVDRVAGDHEIAPGIRLRPAPGHTPGNVVIELEERGQRAVLSGDVVHHPVQIERPAWSSHFDDDPDRARVTREALLERIADTDTWLMGAHFSGPSALRVAGQPAGFALRD